jgi:DNA-binding response OmpR family regulator
MATRSFRRRDAHFVLLLEQDRELAAELTAALRSAGLSCVWGDGEAAARAHVRRARPGLIVAATWVGKRRGCEICAALKSRPGDAATPVIYLSANQMADVICRRGPAGGVYSLRKPCAPEALVALARGLLASNQVRRRRRPRTALAGPALV